MLFCMTAEATPEMTRSMIDNPDDREQAARKAIEVCGGKLIAWYMMGGGPREALAIYDMPDPAAALSIHLVAEASGALQNVQTRRLYTAQEFAEAAKQAQKMAAAYKLPGQR